MPALLRSSDFGLMLIAFAWGSTYLGAKVALATFPIAVLLLLRFSLAAAALAPIAWRDGAPVPRRPAVILGLLLAASLLLETAGIAATTPANAGVLIATSIVLVPLLERWLDRGSGAFGALLPALLSLAGCALMSLSDELRLNAGDLLILAAAVTRSVHMIVARKLGKRLSGSASRINLIQFVTVAMVAALVSLARGELTFAVLAAAPASAWFVVAYLAIVCTVLAFVCMQKAVERTSASRAGLLLGTEPVWAAAIAVTLGGAALSPRQWLGAALVVAAAEWGRRAVPAVATSAAPERRLSRRRAADAASCPPA